LTPEELQKFKNAEKEARSGSRAVFGGRELMSGAADKAAIE